MSTEKNTQIFVFLCLRSSGNSSFLQEINSHCKNAENASFEQNISTPAPTPPSKNRLILIFHDTCFGNSICITCIKAHNFSSTSLLMVPSDSTPLRFQHSKHYLAGLLLRVLAVAIVILFIHTTGQLPATTQKPAARQEPEGTEVTAGGQKIRSLDTFSVLEAVKLPGCLLVTTMEPAGLPFTVSAPGLVIEKYDDTDSGGNMESVRASTITIVIGGKDEIYRVREIATDLAARGNRAVHYYPDGVESLQSLAGILKTHP